MATTLPAALSAALALPRLPTDVWIEIEGLPYGYGSKYQANTWFSGRDTQHGRRGIRHTLAAIPTGAQQQIEPLEATSSIGQITVRIADDDPTDGKLAIDALTSFGRSAVEIAANVGRTDKWLRLGTTNAWAASTAYALGALVKPTSGSTAAGNRHWWKCTTAGTSGASEPAWPTSGTVADGTAVWTEMGTLDLDASTTPNNIPYAGTAADADYPASSGLLYLGRETIAVTSKVAAANGGGYFTGLTRWAYQLDGFASKVAHTEGDIISAYPRFLATRRISCYFTLDGTDTNKESFFSGTIRDYKFGPGQLDLELTCESIERELKVTLFGDQRKARLAGGYWGPGGSAKNDFQPQDGEPMPAANVVSVPLDPASTQGQTWTTGEYVYLRIDDEVFCAYVVQGTSPTSPATVTIAIEQDAAGHVAGRGLWNTTKTMHHRGAEVREVFPTMKPIGSGPLSQTKFTAGDHPLEVVLQLVCSTGNATNGGYDTLGANRGAGIDQTRIDLAGIQSTRDTWLTDAPAWNEIIDAPFVLKDKISEILKGIGCYYTPALGNLWTMKHMVPPMPGATGTTFDQLVILSPPEWSGNVRSVVGRVLFQCDWDPLAGRFLHTYRAEILGPGREAQEFYPGLYRTAEVAAKGFYTGLPLGSGFTIGQQPSTGADKAAAWYADLIRERYGQPPSILVVETDLSTIANEVGDLIGVTEPSTINISTGARGLTGVTFEVQAKDLDLAHGVIRWTLLQTYYGTQYRYIAPAGRLSAWDSVNKIATLVANKFSDSASGSDASRFAVGDKIRIFSWDLKTLRGGAGVTAISGNNVTLDAAPAGVGANDAFILDTYDNATAARRAKSAFVCGNANPPTLGPTTKAAPHQLSS